MRLQWVIEILAVTCVLGLLLQSRRTLRHQAALLNNRLSHLESVMNGFMKECEKTLSEFSIRIAQKSLDPIPPLANQSSMTTASLEVRNLSVNATPPSRKGLPKMSTRPEPAGSRVASKDMKETVLRLACHGATAQDIASRLGLPLGEIELILNLRAASTHPKKIKSASLSC